MKVVIVGGHGFLGRQLAHSLMQRGTLTGHDGKTQNIDELILVDQVEPNTPVEGVTSVIGDIAEPGFLKQVITDGVESVFHLASIVSSAAEADFDLGMHVNLDATRIMLECCRNLPVVPRMVFTSSVAVFGNAPSMVEDNTPAIPLSSYGMQKVVGEYLANEYARKGYVDSRCVRLPTIAIRPGKPNKAASSFVSSILREPLQGQQAICPVENSLKLWIQSPRVVIENLIHAHEIPGDMWKNGPRILNLPGLTVTVGEMIEALKQAGGDTSLIRWEPDAAIERIVGSWPGAMNTVRADHMGFQKDDDMKGIIESFMRDELSKTIL